MNIKSSVSFLKIIFAFQIIYHIVLWAMPDKFTIYNPLVFLPLCIMLIYGAFIGLRGINKVSIKNTQSVGLLFLSLGILSNGIAYSIYTYLAIKDITVVPSYPSVSDYIWLLSILFYILGYVVYIYIFRHSIKLQQILITLFVCLISFYFIAYFIGLPEWSNQIGISLNEKFFDFFYSAFDFITIGLSIIILGIAGGRIYKGLFIFNIGILLTGIADFILSVRGPENTWSGDWGDILFSMTGYFTALGIVYLVNNLVDNN